MTVASNQKPDDVVRVTVYSEGNKISDTLGIISVEVFRAINRVGRCTLMIQAGNMPKGEVPESDSETFAPGKKISVNTGYGSDEKNLFKGFVTSHKLSIQDDNECFLEIECREFTYPLTQGRKNRVFTSKKDSEVISTIIGDYPGLSIELNNTSIVYNELMQYYSTDWDFMLSRADVNGFVVSTDGTKVMVKAPEVEGNPVVKITYGMNLISFEGDLTVDEQQGKVSAVGWDISQQEVINVTGVSPTLNKQGNMTQESLATAAGANDYILQTQVCAGEASLQSWANAQLLKAGLARIQGSVKFYGNASVIPGCLITLDGLGKRFNGNAYIGTVEHYIGQGQWITTAGMGLPFENITDKNDVTAPDVSGLLPGIRGLHIGKVKKLEDDPANENRIEVEIPIIAGENNLMWARLGTNWASKGYGSFFIPDVGDEVILGFFNNDPCHPVILGSLYSSSQIIPYILTKENYTRGIVTKQKMKLTFNEEDKIITLETPGGNKLTISDKDKGIILADENNNKLTMNNDGIVLDSAGHLTLKAKRNITIDAGAALNNKAKTDIKTEGLNVETKAKMTLKMQGTASAEISASGNTIVKGALVMIN